MEGGSSSPTSGNDTDTTEDTTTPGVAAEQPVTAADGEGVVSDSPALAAENNMAESSGQQLPQQSPRTTPSARVADSQPGLTTSQIHEKIPSPTTLSKAKLPSLPGVAPHISGSIGDMATPALLPPLSTKAGDWKAGVNPSSQKAAIAPQDAMGCATTRTGPSNNNASVGKGSSGGGTEGSGDGSSAYTPNDEPTPLLPKGKPLIEPTTGVAEAGVPAKGANRRSSTFRSAAMAVMAVKHVQHYRRSSVVEHTDNLRAFVPDMLIKVRPSPPSPSNGDATASI